MPAWQKNPGSDADELQGALQLVRSLNPRPGEALSSNDVEYIVPDAYVEKIKGRWRVRLNDSNMPRLRINDSYSALIKRSDSSDQNQFLKDNLAEARWFLRSIESRNETLMRVAMTIVELQQWLPRSRPGGHETHGTLGYCHQIRTP